MLDALLNSVLPIFAIVGIGMAFSRLKLFDVEGATALNRFVYYIAVPIMLFRLLALGDFGRFDWLLLLGYLATELALYALSFFIFWKVLKRGVAESILLALAVIFANHFFYVLPIAVAHFGPAIAPQIGALIAVDVVLFYGGTVVLLELIGGRSNRVSGVQTILKVVANPPIIAISLGVLASLLKLPLDNGLGVFAKFVGDAAAPCSLFALGVVLAAQKYKGGQLVPWIIVAVKLLGVPLAAFLVLVFGFGFELPRVAAAIIVTAGPVGAMPFVLALQYGEPNAEIARAILLSTGISLATLTGVLLLF